MEMEFVNERRKKKHGEEEEHSFSNFGPNNMNFCLGKDVKRHQHVEGFDRLNKVLIF